MVAIKKSKAKAVEGELMDDKPKKRGVQTKYKPEFCHIVIEVAQEGGHVAQMCQKMGIRSRETFYQWTRKHPEFAEAYEESRIHSQAFYENLLLAGTLGQIKNFNFSGLAMIMNAKFSNEYKRPGSQTDITIGQINNIDKLDIPQLDAKIKRLQEKLGVGHQDEADTQED